MIDEKTSPTNKMVGGVFSQWLTAARNPATKDTKNDTRDSENHEDKENGLRFIEINELTHPSNHRGEELTDQGKQRGEDRSSALKSSSFHKIFMAPVTDGAGEPT